ncbi:hypothetical protein, partial [Streptomyces sp. FL07-04A]|uniref:hypothetical protein n=1 Tax=Streptomyces sp. FL07-04A TaxID=3028658 RepID=UPI0029A2D948
QNPNNFWLVSDRSYTYDPSGNVTSVKEGSLGIEERQCFTYDPLGRLSCSGPSAGRASGAASGADRVTIDLPSVCFPGGR